MQWSISSIVCLCATSREYNQHYYSLNMFQSTMQINYLHCRSNSFKEKPFYEDIYSSFFLRGYWNIEYEYLALLKPLIIFFVFLLFHFFFFSLCEFYRVAVQGIPVLHYSAWKLSNNISLDARYYIKRKNNWHKNTISIRKCKRYMNIVEKATITWWSLCMFLKDFVKT